MIGNKTFIAEVKTHSPSGWSSTHTWDQLFALASEYGDMVSIHTDARWGGSYGLVTRARMNTHKPILAKGIHASDEDVIKAFDAGAHCVLVVGRIPNFKPEACLIEPYTLNELAALPNNVRAVWNSRDVSKLDEPDNQKLETFADARRNFQGWLCQASNIKTVSDIDPAADAVLVGTHLINFVKSL